MSRPGDQFRRPLRDHRRDRLPCTSVGTEKRERQKAGRQARREAEQKAAKRRKGLRRSISTAIAVVVVVGLSLLVTKPWSKSTSSTTTTTKPTTSTTSVPSAQLTANAVSKSAGCPLDPSTKLPNPQFAAPPMTIDASKAYAVSIKTDVGTITASLNVKSSPVAVNSFVFLVNKKYYDCNTFARVIPQFVNQTGDPTGEVPATATPQYPLGSLAMAKTSAAPSGTTSNQFFIVAGTQGESLPPQYALFGQVTSGQDVVQKVNAAGSQSGIPPAVIHRMLSVTVTSS
jgi:cyclophilin family peptidyl-prolyl cis-trans isomerase